MAAPVIEPFIFGVKVTAKVQVVPAAMVALQGAAPEGVAAKSPLAIMLETVKVAPELLVNVTVCAALVEPKASVANVRLVGDRTTGTSPVPDSAMS